MLQDADDFDVEKWLIDVLAGTQFPVIVCINSCRIDMAALGEGTCHERNEIGNIFLDNIILSFRCRSRSESLKYIDSPQFIEIHRISPFPNRSLDIPVVMDIMIHDLDILLSITKNDSIKKIDATGASVVTDFIDLANARIEFNNGLVANLTASRISAKQMRKIRIFQPKSYLGIDLLDKKIDFFEIIDNKDDFIDSKTIQFDNTDALEDELNHFIECIRNDKTPLVSAKDGISALDLGLKIEELINQKREN